MFARLLETTHGRETRLAVANESRAVDHATLRREAWAVQHLLSGERPAVCMVMLPGGPEHTAAAFGTFAAGGILVPVPDKCTGHEAGALLDLLEPDLVLVHSTTAQAAALAALRRPTTIVALTNAEAGPGGGHRRILWQDLLANPRAFDPVVAPARVLPAPTRMVQFTSGSTGRPKGILLSNANLLANLDQNREHLRRVADENVFCPVPQFHAMGGAVVFEHLLHGSGVVLSNRFVPGDDVARMQEHACVAVLASPNWFKLMLRLGALSRAHLPRLRSFTLGTAAIDTQLVRDLRTAFPAATIHLRYGLSESVGAMTRLDLGPGEVLDDPGMVGPLVPGTILRPGLPAPGHGEPGEIAVRSPANAIGQLVARDRCEPLTDDSGFLPTGDLGHVDAHGRIHLRGRITTFLKSGGHRVNPFEIEGVLREVPGVQEAVVVGVDDPVLGQRIVACVEPQPGHAAPGTEALQQACQERLSPHKIPHRFVVLPSLPRTHAGKPDRRQVLAQLSR
ncbi:MAG: AMP-binding protein [Planctomycetes bacterium]|nr:AMP-binding protein [Planctomycetota bacterium]